jgi:hypothetical protein
MENTDQIANDSSGRAIWEWWCKQVKANGIRADVRERKGTSSDGPCTKCQFLEATSSNAEFGLSKCSISGVTRVISKPAAQDLALQGSPILIFNTCLNQILFSCDFDEEHVSHVAPYHGRPGIVGSFLVPNPEADHVLDVQVFLIDGTHRAVHALRAGIPYSAYVLNFHETFSSTAFFGPLFNPKYGSMHGERPDAPDPKDVAEWVGCKVEELRLPPGFRIGPK